jgi:hypothetical protein
MDPESLLRADCGLEAIIFQTEKQTVTGAYLDEMDENVKDGRASPFRLGETRCTATTAIPPGTPAGGSPRH